MEIGNKLTDPAPIVLFVYNRPSHTRHTLEALMNNHLADKSDLYIYADGPIPGRSPSIFKEMQEVREVIRERNWCKSVVIVERDENLGLANSVISGISELLRKNKKLIILEDDLVTSPDFLGFMNKALQKYQSHNRVAGISGFSYVDSEQIRSNYFLPIGCSWGWGTWKRQWESVNFNVDELVDRLDKTNQTIKIDFGDYPFYNMLLEQRDGNIDSWAIRFYTDFFIRKQYFLYPQLSLVRNMGFDQSGKHTGEQNERFNSRIGNQISQEFGNVELNQEILDLVRSEFSKIHVKEIKKHPLKTFIKRAKSFLG